MESLLVERCRLSVVLKRLFFPLTYPMIIESLRKGGFEIEAIPPPPVPFGVVMEVGGRIARKGGCSVILDPGRKIMSYEGSSLDEVIKGFNDLLTLISEDFNVHNEDIDYCELLLELTSKPRRSALEISREIKFGELYTKASAIIGEEVCPYIISFVPKKRSPGDRNWLDIRLFPLPPLPERYGIQIVFRRESNEEVLSFTKEAEKLAWELIKACEELK